MREQMIGGDGGPEGTCYSPTLFLDSAPCMLSDIIFHKGRALCQPMLKANRSRTPPDERGKARLLYFIPRRDYLPGTAR